MPLQLNFLLYRVADICWNLRAELFVLCQAISQFLFELWQNPFVLELMERLIDDVLWLQIFDLHHVQKHVVTQMERTVEAV